MVWIASFLLLVVLLTRRVSDDWLGILLVLWVLIMVKVVVTVWVCGFFSES